MAERTIIYELFLLLLFFLWMYKLFGWIKNRVEKRNAEKQSKE